MRKSKESSARKTRNYKIILISLVTLLIGIYLLEYVSALEEPPLGATFNIIFGLILIAGSIIVLFLTIKKQFFKKRRSQSKYVYLNKDANKKENQK